MGSYMDLVMMQIQDEGERDLAIARAYGNTCGYCDGLMHETSACGAPERYLADDGCGFCLTFDHPQYDSADDGYINCGAYAAQVRKEVAEYRRLKSVEDERIAYGEKYGW